MKVNGRTPPRTRQAFQNLRSHSWACLKCGWNMDSKFAHCPECGSQEIQYFASKKELQRWAHLRLGVRAGLYSHLRVQPEFPIVINGMKICTYRADFQYTDLQQKKMIVEDVKGSANPKHLDPVFKLKMKMVRAVYGLEIKIVVL